MARKLPGKAFYATVEHLIRLSPVITPRAERVTNKLGVLAKWERRTLVTPAVPEWLFLTRRAKKEIRPQERWPFCKQNSKRVCRGHKFQDLQVGK